MMLFGMFSCLGRKKKKTSNMTPNHHRRNPQPERRPNNTRSKSPLVNLPPELRQRILFFLVSDEQLLYSVPLAIEFCHQDKTYTGPPKRQKRIFLNFTYMTMRELIFPDMSDVHSVLAEDMEWVKKGWVARARNLYTADEVQREFASKYVDFRAWFVLSQPFEASPNSLFQYPFIKRQTGRESNRWTKFIAARPSMPCQRPLHHLFLRGRHAKIYTAGVLWSWYVIHHSSICKPS